MRFPVLAVLTLALLTLSAAACGREAPTQPVVPGPSPEPTPTATVETWLLGYGDEGLSVYDADTGERTDLDAPPLWMADVDIRDDTGTASTGLLAVRTVSGRDLPVDLSLTVLRMPSGEALKVIPLVSAELA